MGGAFARVGVRRLGLVLDTAREHRVGAAAWVLGGGLAMVGMTAALAEEMADFPGGAPALAASVAAGAEAMRPLRWPAERMDTLGGYLTYHNVLLFTFLMAVYGLVQGARDIRGNEEAGSLDMVVVTGIPRRAVVRDRALGFALVAAVIGLGLGLSVAAGLALGDQPDLAGSLATMGTGALVAMVGYGLGMLLGQVVGSARAAGGIGSALLAVLYVTTNVVDPGDPAAWLLWASPFHWANQSRALVPGIGVDPGATLALMAMAGACLGLAAAAFALRDLGAPLWRSRRGDRAAAATGRHDLPRRMLGSTAGAAMRRGWRGTVIWALCTAAFGAMFATMQPAVMDVWDDFDFLTELSGATGGTSIELTYWSFAADVLAPILAAYVITQASGWVAELAQGRVEMVLSTPVSWSMLVRGRLAAAVVGAGIVTVGGIAGLWIGAGAVGSGLEAARVARLLAVGVMFGAAVASVAAIAVAVLRRGAVVTVMALLVGAFYLVAYVTPIFQWPDWLSRTSVFWAFGHPYLGWPPTTALVMLALVALAGGVVAAALAERTPKVG